MTTKPPELIKITTHTFRLKKKRREKFTVLTAYDYLTARAVDWQVSILSW